MFIYMHVYHASLLPLKPERLVYCFWIVLIQWTISVFTIDSFLAYLHPLNAREHHFFTHLLGGFRPFS